MHVTAVELENRKAIIPPEHGLTLYRNRHISSKKLPDTDKNKLISPQHEKPTAGQTCVYLSKHVI